METGRETFGDVIRVVIGDRTQSDVAEAAGVSAGYLNDWLGSRRPRLETLLRAVAGWEAKGWLWPALRARLFRAAGYVDPEESQPGDRVSEAPPLTYEPVYENVDVKAFRQGRDLPDADREELNETIELLLEQRRKRLGLN